MEAKDFEESDIDRHLKKILKVAGVSNRIQSLATKRRQSVKAESKEEREERILVNFLRPFWGFSAYNFYYRKAQKAIELNAQQKSTTMRDFYSKQQVIVWKWMKKNFFRVSSTARTM